MITAYDMQQQALRYLGGDNNRETVEDCREAISNALNDFWGEHDWPWYQQSQSMILSAPYDTGTVEYNATTRQFTLTTGIWPDWADYGTIVVGTKFARIDTRVSSTVVTIEEGTQFTANLAPGQAYKLYRNEYPLPQGVRKVSYLANDNLVAHAFKYITPLEFLTRKPTIYSSSRPFVFTVAKDRRINRGLNITIWPFPTTAMTLRFPYVRAPKSVAVWLYEDGKASTTASSATITGHNTTWESLLEGAVFRLGRDGTNQPTSTIGPNPALEEHMVSAVGGATAITLNEASVNSKTASKYTISSPVDIDTVLMKSAFDKLVYLRIAEIRNKDAREMGIIRQNYDVALRKAIMASSPASQITYAGQRSPLMTQWYEV